MRKCELSWLRHWGYVGLSLSAVGQAGLGGWRVLPSPDAWQPESQPPVSAEQELQGSLPGIEARADQSKKLV